MLDPDTSGSLGNDQKMRFSWVVGGFTNLGKVSWIDAELRGPASGRVPDFHDFTAHLGVIAYPGSRLEESAFAFGNTVAVSPQAPFAFELGAGMRF